MSRYIDVDRLIGELKSLPEQERIEYMGIYDCIKSVPTADDVKKVEYGKWIDVFEREVYIPDEKTTIALTRQKCSNCGIVTTFKGPKLYLYDYFCPNCGAKMDGKEDE